MEMAQRTSTPKRRMGSLDSEMSAAMLDGAEKILREEGYGALTSRRIADEINVKQRLVYYYFHTMDDLIVETFRRLRLRETARLEQTVQSKHPLREIWEVCIHTEDSRLIAEFMALAHRIDALRAEVIAFIEDSRRIQFQALSKALKKTGAKSAIPPIALVTLATSVALALNREARLGVHTGHKEINALIARFLKEIEANQKDEAAAGKAPKTRQSVRKPRAAQGLTK
jgi:AcrR family transcriptional regulator